MMNGGNITHNAVLKCGERELDLVKTYTGHERDSVLGMYYAKARMYDTADKHGSTKANKLGDKRFTAIDPVKGDVRNPQTMVQYTYVINNPLMYVDPLGEMAYTKQFDDFCEGLLESVGNEANELKDSLSSILDTDIRDIGSGLATLGKALWNGEIDLVEVAKDAGTEVAVEATYLATHADVFMPFSDKYTDQEIREAGVRVGAVLLAVSPSKKASTATKAIDKVADVTKNKGKQQILESCPTETLKHNPNDGKHKGTSHGNISENPFWNNVEAGKQALNSSYVSADGKERFNIYNGKIVKFRYDNVGGWHPYTVSNTAKEVPKAVLEQMRDDGLITTAEYKKLIKNK